MADRAGTYRLVVFNEKGQFSPTVNPDGSATSNSTVVNEIDNNAFDSLMQPLETSSAAIYSNTAGELFWDRENTRFDGAYVISVDGEYVARRTTDTSIVVNNHPRNRQVQVTISAQESDVEMAWVTFSFDTSVSSFPSARSRNFLIYRCTCLFGILDHFIVGQGGQTSLAERGLM